MKALAKLLCLLALLLVLPTTAFAAAGPPVPVEVSVGRDWGPGGGGWEWTDYDYIYQIGRCNTGGGVVSCAKFRVHICRYYEYGYADAERFTVEFLDWGQTPATNQMQMWEDTTYSTNVYDYTVDLGGNYSQIISEDNLEIDWSSGYKIATIWIRSGNDYYVTKLYILDDMGEC